MDAQLSHTQGGICIGQMPKSAWDKHIGDVVPSSLSLTYAAGQTVFGRSVR